MFGPDSELTIVSLAELNKSQKLAAAFLIIESLPAYYLCEGVDTGEIASAVADQIGVQGSDIGSGFVTLSNAVVVGVVTYLQSAALSFAQLVEAQGILRSLSRESRCLFRKHLEMYDRDFDTVPSGSLYLSRFAVDKKFRGGGLAKQMIDIFFNIDRGKNEVSRLCSLHVDRDNQRAIRFYTKCGFVVQGSKSRYLTMVRSQDLLA